MQNAKTTSSAETAGDLKVVAILSINAETHVNAHSYEIVPLPDKASDSMRNPKRKA